MLKYEKNVQKELKRVITENKIFTCFLIIFILKALTRNLNVILKVLRY